MIVLKKEPGHMYTHVIKQLKKGETQMINRVTVEDVTHTHYNLINNKKINIYAIFIYFLCEKNI